MENDNVITFKPKSVQEDAPLASPDSSPVNVFDSLDEFLVLGIDEDGNEKFISNTQDFATIMWLLERFKGKLLGYIQE